MVTFGVMFRPGQFPLSHVIACIKVAEDVGFRNEEKCFLAETADDSLHHGDQPAAVPSGEGGR